MGYDDLTDFEIDDILLDYVSHNDLKDMSRNEKEVLLSQIDGPANYDTYLFDNEMYLDDTEGGF